jgi:predicted PurR-regulated permease PerM
MLIPPLEARDRRLLGIVLLLAAVALSFVVVGFIADLFYFFGDIILVFFLAWLIAFIISPIVSRLATLVPRLPHAVATLLVFALVVAVALVALVSGAAALAGSITQFLASIPQIERDLPTILAPFQAWLGSLGLEQVDLVAQATALLANLDDLAGSLVQPLQQLAVASIGVVGLLLITFFLSVWMVLDRDRILAFLYRLIPPGRTAEARLLQSSVSSSFGGFLRGQALMGGTYFVIAFATHLLLGLPLTPLSAVTAGILMAIPFFGPFVSFAPPILVALIFVPDAIVATAIIMGSGWFVLMNILQPRIMQGAVGIHPIVVLGSVLVGAKLAGIAGAIFGIPIAAVISAFFFHYLGEASAERTVTSRAARRLEQRGGRNVRVPREPEPGADEEIPDELPDDASAGPRPERSAP